nr:endonuclease III [Desulforamulus aquiferis]
MFKNYSTPGDFAGLTPEQLALEIKGCGLFRNKSRFIVDTSKIILERYQGQVPDKREDLEKLPGVGRKTANVVLGVAFGQSTFPVDTHVHRLAQRWGLSNGKGPEQSEKDLCQVFPEALWQRLHHQMILHGRRICLARSPRCELCGLIEVCPSANNKGAPK